MCAGPALNVSDSRAHASWSGSDAQIHESSTQTSNKHTLYVDLEQNTENYSNPQQGINNPESSHSDVCDRSDKISNPSTSQFVYFDYCAFSGIIVPVVKLEIGKECILCISTIVSIKMQNGPNAWVYFAFLEDVLHEKH